MTVNLNEATQKIKQAGGLNTRIVPMEGQTIDGKCQIEVREGGTWQTVVEGLTPRMAQDLVAQATNRVIIG